MARWNHHAFELAFELGFPLLELAGQPAGRHHQQTIATNSTAPQMTQNWYFCRTFRIFLS